MPTCLDELARAVIFRGFLHQHKSKILVKDVEYSLFVKFHHIPSSGSRGIVQNVSANQRLGLPSCFPIGPKNINLVEDVEFLLPFNMVKSWRHIPFSGFSEEVENVSANQRPGGHLVFQIGLKTW